MTRITNRTIAFGFAGALALGISGAASAGPLPTGTATVKSAVTDQVTDVQWRGRHHRGHRGWGPGIGIGAGIAAGALIGSAVASRPYYGGYYYEEPVYAAPYAYETPYAYEPVYPSYGYRGTYGRNYCEEGYRRVQCSQGGGY